MNRLGKSRWVVLLGDRQKRLSVRTERSVLLHVQHAMGGHLLVPVEGQKYLLCSFLILGVLLGDPQWRQQGGKLRELPAGGPAFPVARSLDRIAQRLAPEVSQHT